MPLQGALLTDLIAQGDALGYELLPFQGVLGNFNHTGGRIGLHGLSAASSLSHIHAVAYRKMQLRCWRRPLMVRQPYSEAV